eukprot:jgi/Tetstr1/459689/TSEL_005044.t1
MNKDIRKKAVALVDLLDDAGYKPQMAWMRIMFRHGLDMMVVSRCAPQHSWANAVERCMAPLNIMLQNCPLARQKIDDGNEKLMKACNNITDVRARCHHSAKHVAPAATTAEEAPEEGGASAAQQGGAISPAVEGGSNSAAEEGGANIPAEQSVAEEAASEEEPENDDDEFNMLESGDDSDSEVEFVGEREGGHDTTTLDDDDDAEMIDGAVNEVPFHVVYLNSIAPLRGMLEQRFARAAWNQQPYALHKPASSDDVRLT